jgi:hypothetical protein
VPTATVAAIASSLWPALAASRIPQIRIKNDEVPRWP